MLTGGGSLEDSFRADADERTLGDCSTWNIFLVRELAEAVVERRYASCPEQCPRETSA